MGGEPALMGAARPSRGGLTMRAAAGEVLSMSADFGGGGGGAAVKAPRAVRISGRHLGTRAPVGTSGFAGDSSRRERGSESPPGPTPQATTRRGRADRRVGVRPRAPAGETGHQRGWREGVVVLLRKNHDAANARRDTPTGCPPAPAGCCHDPVCGGGAAAVGIGCCLAHPCAAVSRTNGCRTSRSSPAPMGALVCGRGGGTAAGGVSVGGGAGQRRRWPTTGPPADGTDGTDGQGVEMERDETSSTFRCARLSLAAAPEAVGAAASAPTARPPPPQAGGPD